MVYLPTFTIKPNVGKYTIHGWYGLCCPWFESFLLSTCSPEHVPKESWPLGAQSGWCPETQCYLKDHIQSISSWDHIKFISHEWPDGRGMTPARGLTGRSFWLLSNWDGPPSTVLSQRSLAVSFVVMWWCLMRHSTIGFEIYNIKTPWKAEQVTGCCRKSVYIELIYIYIFYN